MRGVGLTLGSIIAIAVVLAVVLIGFPTYNVYSKQMAGKAAYEEAVQNRRIRVLEAQAALDSAKLTAAAEIDRRADRLLEKRRWMMEQGRAV